MVKIGRIVSGAAAAFMMVMTFLSCNGCTRPDLRITQLTVDSYSQGQNARIDYSFTIENRDWGGNILVKPGSVALPVSVQAWTSRDGTLDVGSYARLAGGTSVGHAGSLLRSGETITGSFSSTADINLAERPYFVLMVDHQNLVTEYNESNNIKSLLIAH